MNREEAAFLAIMDNDRNKKSYARVIILDKNEKPIKSIEGRVLDGSSISLNGNSSVRRTCSLNLIADEAENDLTEIDNFLSVNRKVKIEIGLKYNINFAEDVLYFDKDSDLPEQGQVNKIYVVRKTFTNYYWDGIIYQEINSIFDYPDVITWFPLGVFVITQPNLTHNSGGCNITLNLKDKMCLLNGEISGGLPTSITFHEYDQVIGEVDCSGDPRYDATIVPNEYTVYKYNNQYYQWSRKYGWTEGDKSLIGTIIHMPQLFYDIIQTVVVRWGNESASRVIINDVPIEIKQLVRWTSSSPLYHNTATGQYTTNELFLTSDGVWRTFEFNEDIGYVYTDFTFPGELISNIGDNVCSVLDKVIAQLGNYEYFYDIDGNFVFQEKKNYLNTSYLPTEVAYDTQKFYLDNKDKKYRNQVISLDNNSLCILGRENYKADFYGDQKLVYNFQENDKIVASYSNTPSYTNLKNDYHIWGKNGDGYAIHYHLAIKDKPKNFTSRQVVFLKKEKDKDSYSGMIRLATSEDNVEDIVEYMPNDWRAELYLQGLEIQRGGGRPDIYQQELLDLFDMIYEWGYYDSTKTWIPQGRFKTDIVNKPNDLQYFLDYLEPVDNLYSVSIDDIGTKMFSYQQDKIIKLYDMEVPDYIIIDESMDPLYMNTLMKQCDYEGQKHNIVDKSIYANIAIGTKGYSAQETVRNYLYQYTNYNEQINIQCLPIYYLDVNRRIAVKDKKTGINGDYIINSITMPLNPISLMTITATRALNRIPQNYSEYKNSMDELHDFVSQFNLIEIGFENINDECNVEVIRVPEYYFDDEVSDFNIIEITQFESVDDNVDINLMVPISIVNSDTVSDFNIVEITFENATDSVVMNTYVSSEALVTEDGDSITTEGGDYIYLEGD